MEGFQLALNVVELVFYSAVIVCLVRRWRE